MSDRTYKPTSLHTSIDGINYLCGSKREGSWHERCMTDRFARSLPLCEGCEEVKVAMKKEMSRRMAGGDRVGKSPNMERPAPIPTKNILSSPSIIDSDAGIYVSDYRRDA